MEDSRAAATAWLVCGAPGSGKSVLGRALAAALPGVLLDQDVLTGPLTGVVTRLVGAEADDLDDPRVRSALGPAAYEALFDTAADNLRSGAQVVLVAPFTRVLWSTAGLALLSRLGPVHARVVWTRCPPQERLRRLAVRDAPRDRRKLIVPVQDGAGWDDPPLLPHSAVDSTASIEDQVRDAMLAPLVSVGELADPAS